MAELSADGKQILNNYCRFTGEPFNATVVTTWYNGDPMDDTKVDNVIYFKNKPSLGGGYSRRNFTSFLQLEWWGVKLDQSEDAADKIEACYRMSNFLKIPIKVKAGRIRLDRPVIINGNYWNLQGDPAGTVFTYKGPKPKITTTTTAEPTSYPTASNPGHLDGCCFYFTSNIYNGTIQNVILADGRFGMAFLIPHNSPIFKNVIFANVNCGVIFYTGSQNAQYVNCTTQTNANCLHISSATCFDTNHPLKNQDNYFTDGLFVGNLDGYGSFNNVINDAFDTWFINSILKPDTPSFATGSQNFLYAPGANSEDSKPSGRAIFAPFRAGNRTCFDPTHIKLDFRFASYRGIALYNTVVSNFTVDGGATEAIWNGAPVAQDGSTLYRLGAARSGTFKSATSEGATTTRPLISFTGKGQAQGDSSTEENITFISMNIVETVGKKYQTWKNGAVRTNKLVLNANVDTSDVFDSRVNGGVTRNLSPYISEGIFYGTFNQNVNGSLINTNNSIKETIPYMFELPFKTSDGKYRNSAYLNTGDYWLSGRIKIEVFNTTQNSYDFGEFYIQDGVTASESYTTAADVNNEDLFITLTTNPSKRPVKNTVIIVGGAKQVVDYYDTVNRRIYVIGAIGGLSGTVTAGSTVTRERFLITINDFKRDYVGFGFGTAPYSQSMSLLSKVHASETTSLSGDVLRIFITFQSVSSDVAIGPLASMPTTGRYKAGAYIPKAGVTTVNGDTLLGWKRLTNGVNHVLGTDWVEDYAGLSRSSIERKTNVSGAASLGLNVTNEVYVGVGATATWTLPVVSGNTSKLLLIKNRGTGNITLNSNAGANDIYLRSAVASLVIKPGKSVMLICDGTYWNVISSQDQQQIASVAFDGTSTTYSIPHNLTGISTTSLVFVQPRDNSSLTPASASLDVTNTIIRFTTAPPAGTGNYSLNIIP